MMTLDCMTDDVTRLLKIPVEVVSVKKVARINNVGLYATAEPE